MHPFLRPLTQIERTWHVWVCHPLNLVTVPRRSGSFCDEGGLTNGSFVRSLPLGLFKAHASLHSVTCSTLNYEGQHSSDACHTVYRLECPGYRLCPDRGPPFSSLSQLHPGLELFPFLLLS